MRWKAALKAFDLAFDGRTGTWIAVADPILSADPTGNRPL